MTDSKLDSLNYEGPNTTQTSKRDCPVCNDKSENPRHPIFWSKAGMTRRLCERHWEQAREYRRAWG